MFWQAAEEREEKKSVVQADEVGFDTIVGMLYSNLLAYAMIVTGAVMIYGAHRDIADVATLAQALRPAVGDYAFALFLVGIVAAGFLAIPVLAGSTAYAVADTFGWREGINYKVSDAKGFYVVFIGALIIANSKTIMGAYVATRFQNVFSFFAMAVTLGLTGVMFWQIGV